MQPLLAKDRSPEFQSPPDAPATAEPPTGTTPDMVMVVPILRPETHPEAFIPVAPDSGWSWIILLASVLTNVIIDGICFSIGLLLVDISDHLVASKAKVALIGSLFYGFYHITGPIAAAMINRFGCRTVAATGSLLASLMFLISAFMTSVTGLLLTFGLFGGASFGFIHLPTVISVNFYFCRKRALANGIAVTGSPIGAVIFGPLLSYLIQTYTYSNTLIILAGILLHCTAFACLYRPLLPTVGMKTMESACLLHHHHPPAGTAPGNLDTLWGTGLSIPEHLKLVNSTGTLFTHHSSIAIPLSLLEDPGGLFRSGAVLYNSNCPMDKRPLVEVEEENQSAVDGEAVRGSKPRGDWSIVGNAGPRPGSRSTGLLPGLIIRVEAAKSELPSATQPPVDDQGPISFTVPGTGTMETGTGVKKDQGNFGTYSPNNKEGFQEKKSTLNAKLVKEEEPGNPRPTATTNSIHSTIFSTPCLTTGIPDQNDKDNRNLRRPRRRTSITTLVPLDSSRSSTPAGKYRWGSPARLPTWAMIAANCQGRSILHGNTHSPTVPTITESNNEVDHYSASGNLSSHYGSKGPPKSAAAAVQPLLEFSSMITLPPINSGWEGIQRQLGYQPSLSIRSEIALMEGGNERPMQLRAAGASNRISAAKLVELTDKQPAIVVLPHQQVSIQDYRRPMYRADIFYRGSVVQTPPTRQQQSKDVVASDHVVQPSKLPTSLIGRHTSDNHMPDHMVQSAFSLTGLFGSAVLRRNVSAIQPVQAYTSLVTSSRLSFTDSAAVVLGGAEHQQDSRWISSYLVSMTRIPVPDQNADEETAHSAGDTSTVSDKTRYAYYPLEHCCCYPCRWFATAVRRRCTKRGSGKMVVTRSSSAFGDISGGNEDADEDLNSIYFGDGCLTCLRRIRDGRMFMPDANYCDENKKKRKNFCRGRKSEPNQRYTKGGQGDLDLEESESQESIISDEEIGFKENRFRCSWSCSSWSAAKSFTDIIRTMTDCRLIRNPDYLVALVANFCCVLGMFVPVLYVSDLALFNGIPSSQAFYFIFAMGLANIPGRLVFAWFIAITHISPLLLMTVTLVLLGCTIVSMPFCTGFISQVIAFSLHGLLSGPFVSLSSVILCDLVGIDSLTNAVGLITLVRGLSNVLGPPFVGLLFEATQSFQLPYLAAGLVNMIAGVLFAYIYYRTRRRRLDPSPVSDSATGVEETEKRSNY